MCVWFPRELNSRAQARRELQGGLGGLCTKAARGHGLWSTLPSNINITYYTQILKNKGKASIPVFPSFSPICLLNELVACTNTVSSLWSFRLCPYGQIHQLNSSPRGTGLNKERWLRMLECFSHFYPSFMQSQQTMML